MQTKVEAKAAYVCQPKVPRGAIVYVVGELEILSEVESVRGHNEPVGLESYCRILWWSLVPRERHCYEPFQGNFDIRDGYDNTTRNTGGYSEENCTVL